MSGSAETDEFRLESPITCQYTLDGRLNEPARGKSDEHSATNGMHQSTPVEELNASNEEYIAEAPSSEKQSEEEESDGEISMNWPSRRDLSYAESVEGDLSPVRCSVQTEEDDGIAHAAPVDGARKLYAAIELGVPMEKISTFNHPGRFAAQTSWRYPLDVSMHRLHNIPKCLVLSKVLQYIVSNVR